MSTNKSTNKKIDFRDVLASFFRVFSLIVRIQSFIKNDQPFAGMGFMGVEWD
jgi:hypothetical protein